MSPVLGAAHWQHAVQPAQHGVEPCDGAVSAGQADLPIEGASLCTMRAGFPGGLSCVTLTDPMADMPSMYLSNIPCLAVATGRQQTTSGCQQPCRIITRLCTEDVQHARPTLEPPERMQVKLHRGSTDDTS